MIFAYLIVLMPLLVCLCLLVSCVQKRARFGRLPRRWRGIAVYSAFFAALYVPVVYFFCHQAGHYDSQADARPVPVSPALIRAGFIPAKALRPAPPRRASAVAP